MFGAVGVHPGQEPGSAPCPFFFPLGIATKASVNLQITDQKLWSFIFC